MISGFVLGDAKQDVINALAAVLGVEKATQTVTTGEDFVKTAAKTGAVAAIPDITKQVEAAAKKAVTPLVIGAIAAGGLGFLAGMTALIMAKKTRNAMKSR